MTVTVKCTNKDCSHYKQKREVARPHLGQFVFVGGPLLCECGHQLVDVE